MINKLEDFSGDVMELVVDRANDGFDSAFHGLDTRLERARVVLCVVIQPREAHQRVQGRHLHELQVLQALFLLAPSLSLSKTTTKSNTILFPKFYIGHLFSSILSKILVKSLI